MASRRKRSEADESPRRPARTPQGRENELIAMAHDLAEQQFRDETASSQVITHFLKLGSSREILEQERIRHENELLQAKREHMASQARVEEMYDRALRAMATYSGKELPPEDIYEEQELFEATEDSNLPRTLRILGSSRSCRSQHIWLRPLDEPAILHV